MDTLEQRLHDRLRDAVADLKADPGLLGRAHSRAGRRRTRAVVLTMTALAVAVAAVLVGVPRVVPTGGVALRSLGGAPEIATEGRRLVEVGAARLLVPASWAVDDGQPPAGDRLPPVCATPPSQPILWIGEPTARCTGWGDGVRLPNPGVAVHRGSDSLTWGTALLREGIPVDVGATTGFRLVTDGNDLVAIPDLDLVLAVLPGTRAEDVDMLLATMAHQDGFVPGPFLVWDARGVLTARHGQVITLMAPDAGQEVYDVTVAPGGTREDVRLAVSSGSSGSDRRRVTVLAVRGGQAEPLWSGDPTWPFAVRAVVGLEGGVIDGGPAWSPDGGHLAFLDAVDDRAVLRVVSLEPRPAEVISPVLEVDVELEEPTLHLARWTEDDRLAFIGGNQDAVLTLPVVRTAGGRVELPSGRLQLEPPAPGGR